MLKIFCQRAAVVASLCAAMVGTVHAATTTWHLSGVTFADGATATGWFDYDDVAGIGNYDLTTSSSATFSGFNYVPGNSSLWSALPLDANNFAWLIGDRTRFLTFTFTGPLTGAGGNVDIRRDGYAFSGSWEHDDNLGDRVVVYPTGYPSFISPLSAVPEVETLAMLLAGLGLVGAVARRRRSVRAG